MALRADTRLLKEIKRYGAFDISSCFNCGNCTAVCELSEGDDAFPRRMIRYAQLGLRDHLISQKEIWLCHHCGECSETCPRQAGPAEFMAASRRFAISAFDPSGLSRWLHLSTVGTIAIMGILSAVVTGILLWKSGGAPADGTARFSTAAMLDFVSFEIIHDVGLAVLAILGVIAVLTVVNMLWSLSSALVPGSAGKTADAVGMFPVTAAIKAVGLTVADVVFHRHQRRCAGEQRRTAPFLLRRWFVHACIMGGFFGLGAATALDYLLKDPDAHVMPWYPIRLLGIIAGLALTYGSTVALVKRLAASGKQGLAAAERYYAHSLRSDWVFLWLLWLVAVTGFVLTAAIYLPVSGFWPYCVFVSHVVLAIDLLVLMPFCKFAHAIFRPVAIWFLHFRRLRVALADAATGARRRHA